VNGLAALRGRERETDREWTRACDGESRYGSPSDWIAPLIPSLRDEIPTCPACAVLRDAALEGRQDNGPAPHSADPSIDAR
jgi:hypothetical protein